MTHPYLGKHVHSFYPMPLTSLRDIWYTGCVAGRRPMTSTPPDLPPGTMGHIGDW